MTGTAGDIVTGFLILAGAVCLPSGFSLAGKVKGFAMRAAAWANSVNPDHWYFLPGKDVTVVRARIYGCVLLGIGTLAIVAGVGRLNV